MVLVDDLVSQNKSPTNTEKTMPHMDRYDVGTPNWIDLMTPDLDKAKAFYGKLMGWDFFTGPPETGHYTMCIKDGKPVAGMGKMPENAPFPTCWTVYFEADNVDALCEKVKSFGGQITAPPMDVMEEGRMAVCSDPSGAVFGFWQPKNHTGAKIADEPGAMAWFEVNTRTGEKAKDFYAAVMGCEGKKMEGMEYWTLEKPGKGPRYGILQMDSHWPDSVPAHWMSYLAVKKTDESCEWIKANGGKVCVPPFDTPHGRISVVEDPFGAVFSIISDAK
jgi:predicted enzyme related to lactoylglutathione lyase